MDWTEKDFNDAQRLDGNAAAGLLEQCFGADITANLVQCGSCGREGPLGALHAYIRTPGLVLRCIQCSAVMVRVVETPDAIYLDAQGLTFLRLPVTYASE